VHLSEWDTGDCAHAAETVTFVVVEAGMYTYTGQESDENAELYNYNARWYDPTSDRFFIADPSGLEPDPNPYRYVGNERNEYQFSVHSRVIPRRRREHGTIGRS
jgi:RHS repeat-associated protein